MMIIAHSGHDIVVHLAGDSNEVPDFDEPGSTADVAVDPFSVTDQPIHAGRA